MRMFHLLACGKLIDGDGYLASILTKPSVLVFEWSFFNNFDQYVMHKLFLAREKKTALSCVVPHPTWPGWEEDRAVALLFHCQGALGLASSVHSLLHAHSYIRPVERLGKCLPLHSNLHQSLSRFL